MPDLIVAGITIPIEALGDHGQTYERVGGRATLTMADGSQIVQSRWEKLITKVRGDGWAPPGLADIDPAAVVEVACVAPRAISRAGNLIPLPAARRSDAPVRGQAVVAGRVVPTAVVVAGNLATLDAVPGASGYRALYYPLLLARVALESEDMDVSGAAWGWALTAREA